MDIKIEKGKTNTYNVLVTLKPEETKKYLDEALEHEAENIEIEGFRKGKAPMSVVKEKVDKGALRGHALNHIFSEAYSKLIKENKLKPIINPRFNMKTFDDENNVEFEIIIVEKPEIKLGDYKSALQKKYKAKKAEIEKESKSKDNKSEDKSEKQEETEDNADLTNQEIVDILMEVCDVEIAEVIVNEEVERMVSSLIDQTAKMGITIEQYLESTKKTIDEIREDYKKSATNNIKGDFIVTEIANTENITVEDDEIEQTINSIPDEASREALSNPEQKMYIKAVLTKSKTLEYLSEQSKV